MCLQLHKGIAYKKASKFTVKKFYVIGVSSVRANSYTIF
jgi:hypothetical protein